MELNVNIFDCFNKGWALVTAGTADSYNTMTVSWGGMGTLWAKPVATVYIRPQRHTFGFMESNEYFTVSFYPEEYRADLALLGRKSGRDGDKVAETRLTPVAVGDKAMSFKEAKVTLLCRKLYSQDIDGDRMDAAVRARVYPEADFHRMYIGEVVEMIEG